MISDWKNTPFTGIYILPQLGNVIHLECGQWAWMTIGRGWKDGYESTKHKAIDACEKTLKNPKGNE